MNRFRFYYEVVKEILHEEDISPPADATAPPADAIAPPAEEAPPEDSTPAAETPPTDDGSGGSADAGGGDGKDKKDVKDKIDDEKIIQKPDEKSLVTIQSQIDNLSIKILEKKEKISTILGAISFLKKIDDTKPNKYAKEEKYKQLNVFLTSTDYDNLSPSNLFAIHNALKENFKIVQKDFKNKKDSKNMDELKNIAKKATRSRFSKNINSLNDKIKLIKDTLANLNQIFDLKDFPKMPINVQKEIKLAQKNSSDLIKKLS